MKYLFDMIREWQKLSIKIYSIEKGKINKTKCKYYINKKSIIWKNIDNILVKKYGINGRKRYEYILIMFDRENSKKLRKICQ